MNLPISILEPTQTDDGRLSISRVPIEVCLDETRLLIITGHHKYYDLLREQKLHGGDPLAKVKKVVNPYTDF